jgi:hypothetical protein
VTAIAGVGQHAVNTVDELTQAEVDQMLNGADIVTLAKPAVSALSWRDH